MRQPEHVAVDQQPVYIEHDCEINHFGLYNGFITTGIFPTGIFLAGDRASRVSFLGGKGPRGYPHLGTLEGGQTAPGSASVHLLKIHAVFFIRINIFQASLKVILNFSNSQPEKILR